MLSQDHARAYQNLFNALSVLQEQLKTPNPELADCETCFAQIQQIFGEQVMSLSNEELEPDLGVRVQSVQTEIHRGLRLLGTDLLFLRSSRQAATRQQRFNSLTDRLESLRKLCYLILT
jgi:head-tail adaptor